MREEEPRVSFCPTCGHSAMLSEDHVLRLAIGKSDCGRTLRIISLTEWREIADQSDLHLTDAGRQAFSGAKP